MRCQTETQPVGLATGLSSQMLSRARGADRYRSALFEAPVTRRRWPDRGAAGPGPGALWQRPPGDRAGRGPIAHAVPSDRVVRW